MKKLKLDADSLRVATFPTAEADAKARGTVEAHAITATCQTRPGPQCPWSAFPTCGIYC